MTTPGRARTTWGMALTMGSAVMTMAMLMSTSEFDSPSGGHPATWAFTVGMPSTTMCQPWRISQLGSTSSVIFQMVPSSITSTPSATPTQRFFRPATWPFGNLHEPQVEIAGGHRHLGEIADVVEGQLQRVRHHGHRVLEDGGALPELAGVVRVVDRAAEGHRLPQLAGVVARAFGLFPDGDVLHVAAHARRGEGEGVDEPGIDPTAVDRGATLATGLVEDAFGLPPPPGDQVRARHHVDAGLEEPGDLLGMPAHVLLADDGEVGHHVGGERHDLVDAVGGEHPDRVHADQLAHVLPGLFRAVGVTTDQLHLGIVENGPSGKGGDVARGPQHNSYGHLSVAFLSRSSVFSVRQPAPECNSPPR